MTVAEPDPPSVRPRPMRADARRNRLAILEAASALILERGGEIPLEAVAARAGVGVGTLYRRFPDRGALFQALAHHALARVEEAARAAADEGDPAAEWSAFLAAVLALRLGALMPAVLLDPESGLETDAALLERRRTALESVGPLVRRAQAAGLVRADLSAVELMASVLALTRPIPGVPGDVGERLVQRFAVILEAGLRPDGAPLPGRPLVGVELVR